MPGVARQLRRPKSVARGTRNAGSGSVRAPGDRVFFRVPASRFRVAPSFGRHCSSRKRSPVFCKALKKVTLDKATLPITLCSVPAHQTRRLRNSTSALPRLGIRTMLADYPRLGCAARRCGKGPLKPKSKVKNLNAKTLYRQSLMGIPQSLMGISTGIESTIHMWSSSRKAVLMANAAFAPSAAATMTCCKSRVASPAI